MANTPIPDDILDNVYKSNATAGGLYLDRYGRYLLLIEQSMYKQVKDVGRLHITRIKVLESSPLTVTEPATKQQPEARTVTEEPHPIGYRPSYVVNWDGEAKQSADGNCKALVLGIFGMNEAKVTEAEFKATFRDMVMDGQPACGMVVWCEVRPKGVGKTKDEGFSHHIKLPYWEGAGVPGQGKNTFEEMKARRAEVESYIGTEMAREEERFAARAAERDAKAAGGSGGSFLPGNGTPPQLPSGPPAIPGAAPDPLAGWTLNPANKPDDPNPWYFQPGTNNQKRKADIVAGK